MKKIFLSAILLSSILFCSNVYGFGACEADCQKCHTLNNEEARQILTKINAPDAKVLGIKMSQIRGLWEISIENNGRKGILYIGFDKKHIVRGPIIKIEALSKKIQDSIGKKEQLKRYVDYSRISPDNALVMGDKNARHKVFVFTDPDCPFCGKFHAEIQKVIDENKDIAFYIKLYPLKFHKDAYWKSKTIACERSIKLLEDNFSGKLIPKPSCDTYEIDKNIELAEELGITGTPTSIMPNGLVHSGYMTAEKLREKIHANLK